MDEKFVQENLKKIFKMEIITTVIGIIILVLITIAAVGTNDLDPGYYAGFSLCLSVAVVFPITVCVLSFIANQQIATNPKLVYIFSIISLIGAIGGSGGCAIGAGAIGNSIGTNIYWIGWKIEHFEDPTPWMVSLGLHIAVAALFCFLVVLLIFVIVLTSKNLKASSDVMGIGTTTTASRASSQAAVAIGGSSGSGNFCSQCGGANEPDAKFCKKCGKAM